ncbi:MAG: peptidoglycan editing factor PgeF [Synechococcaceae cyanobacterium]|nr:peptidoglycan editing factor PgeF [Synechococcaceae cyanobacterium]
MAEPGAAAPFDRPDAHFNVLPGWTWIGGYGGYHLQADLLAGFEHGFFTRLWHGREPEVLVSAISAGTSVHRLRQVHGGVVVAASQAPAAPWPDADGLVSDGPGQSVWVCGADCTPVLIADPASGRVAACHAGWRGVAARVVPTAIARLEAAGSRREDLLLALGPAVSGAGYQVERSVSLQVAAGLDDGADGDSNGSDGLEILQQAGAVRPDDTPGRDRLDIRAATVLQLQRAGLRSDQLSLCPLCTLAEPQLFHSWRRDQVRAVQWSGIVSQS